MNDSSKDPNQTDEGDLLRGEVSDEVIEATASMPRGGFPTLWWHLLLRLSLSADDFYESVDNVGRIDAEDVIGLFVFAVVCSAIVFAVASDVCLRGKADIWPTMQTMQNVCS
jgi:hypothetical protein